MTVLDFVVGFGYIIALTTLAGLLSPGMYGLAVFGAGLYTIGINL